MWRDKHTYKHTHTHTHTHTHLHTHHSTFAFVLSRFSKAEKINKKIFLAILISDKQREVVLVEYWIFTKNSLLDLELKDRGRVYLIFQVNEKYVTVLLDVIKGKEAGILKFL